VSLPETAYCNSGRGKEVEEVEEVKEVEEIKEAEEAREAEDTEDAEDRAEPKSLQVGHAKRRLVPTLGAKRHFVADRDDTRGSA